MTRPLRILMISLMAFLNLQAFAMAEPLVMPLVHPVAVMEAYAAADFRQNEKWVFRYHTKGGERREKLIFGDGWRLTLSKDVAGAPDALEKFIPEIGATVHFQSGNAIFFEAAATAAETWWVQIEDAGDQYRITQAREVRLNPGSTLNWRFGDGGVREVTFYARCDGGNLIHFRVNLESGDYHLSGDLILDQGNLRRVVSYRKNFKAEYDRLHILNDIPKGIEEPILWRLRRTDSGPPADVSIRLEATVEKPIVQVTDALGALKVQGAGGMSVEAEPLYSVSVSHAKTDRFTSDATPDGDALLWLPAGLWNLKIAPGNVDGIDYFQTCMVPVSSGETTVLTLPDHIRSTLAEGQEGASTLTRNGLNLSALKEDAEGTATAVFTLFDKDAPDLLPALENTVLLEGGTRAEIESIERVETPASIVLLLDSSGSMKGQMEQTISTARQFIASLPEDAFIKVVDFDTRPRELKWATREEMLAGFDAIRADGATALYDSILQGLHLLEAKQRPFLLVFTDGVDANWNDTGPGSEATQEQVFAAVEKSGVPLYTIGFGPGHDKSTLVRLADASRGLYYSAVDQNALENIFTTIKNDLGNTFRLQYKRPAHARSSSVPVISIAIDCSGSMNPLAPGGGILQKVKNLFHDFILKLPEQTPVQVQDYDVTTIVRQLATTNKSEMLQALGELEARGDNDTFKTVKTAFETIQAIGSDKKILIYVSDQDLGLIKPEEQKEFEKLLNRFKEENIEVLWVGFCMDGVEDVFIRTAELSGGDYVISEDPAVLAEKFDTIVSRVAAAELAPPDELPVTLTVRNTTEGGAVHRYADSQRFALSPPEIVTHTVSPGLVSYRTGLPFEQYNPVTKEQLAGDDYPDRDTVISKQIPLDANTRNEAVEIRAIEMMSLDRFRGLDAPDNMQFMAVVLEMENLLPEQDVIVYPDGGSHPAAWVSGNSPEGIKARKIPPYLIKNLASHLYMLWNNKAKYPVSPVTWLAASPFLPPGSLAKMIEPGAPARGLVLFAVPDEHIEQISLHFYDTNYGHAELPLIGKIRKQETALETLPIENEAALSESFSLKIRGMRVAEAIETIAAEKDAVFKIVEADFISKVQALIDISPENYFYYRMPTELGPFYAPIAPATQLLPFGFAHPALFAPGSANRVCFAFHVPRALVEKSPGEIFVELGGGDVIIPLGSNPRAVKTARKYSGDGIDVVVNRLAYTRNKRFLVADITLFDHPDGEATRLINGFQLVRDDFAGTARENKTGAAVTKRKGLAGFSGNRVYDEYLVKPDQKTGELLFGLDDAVIFDGTERRGFILFKVPSGKDHTWTLQSEFFAELAEPVTDNPFPEETLLIHRSRPLLENGAYKEKLNKAIARAIREHQALQATDPRKKLKRMRIDASEPVKETVPVPPVTFGGLEQFSEIENLDELRTLLNGIRWLPGEDGGWVYKRAPEAVLTQGWGTEVDFARMAEKVLIRMGYRPERRMVSVTEKGTEALVKTGDLERVNKGRLPALFYKDARAQEHLLVLPFMKEFADLKGLVETAANQDFYEHPGKAHLEVTLKVVPKSRDRNTQLRDMSNMLSGGDSGGLVEEIRIFSEFLDLETLSMDAVDLGYTVVGREKGELVAAVLETARERIEGKEHIDTGLYRIIGETISVRIGDRGGNFIHESSLSEADAVSGRFHTLGINLPDLTEAAAKRLQNAAENRYRSAESPDELSALRWYTRNIINRFLAGQSRYERELAEKLDLTLGRTRDARCLMVTVSRKSGEEKLQTRIDLMRVNNQIHKGEQTARHAFNIFSGLHASKLEAEVLPGGHLGLFDIWQRLPADTHLVSITYQNKNDVIAYMTDKAFSPNLIEQIERTKHPILLPSKPAIIDGQERWAWLEINSENYRTIAVLDSGERGAMVEHVLGNWQQEGTNFIIGALIGVDAAIWSMSSFSLALDDYDEIKKEAQAFAKSLSENFSGIGDTPGVSTNMGPVTGGFDLTTGKAGVSRTTLGYGDGFSAGVNLFFSIQE